MFSSHLTMKHQEKHVLETVHGLTDEILDFTSRLVAEPSTLGNEGSALRVFHFYGRGEATCYGPEAENIHGANKRVSVESVIHTVKVYALFLARWCGLVE
ncbi:MAG: hypothetical protein QF551_00290 [Candidatus Marinimicrobia bacterium]|nr:hypothetical protein [Candidatus Neomarinimicrobiota bacterium]MDP6965700.1 hypothetical protein [Candidatus Neomarinimicrobiota bacterium]